MPFDFKGRKAVVAGGSRGIGRWIALGFAEAGADVSICARGLDALKATEKDLSKFGHKVHAATCDLADGGAIKRYIADAATALGGIDVLVNNASGFGQTDDEASWETSIDVDILATVRASREALPFLKKERGGNIVNIASGSGLRPSVRTPAYGAAKAAVIHYTTTQAATLAKQGIRVNCVAPGSIIFPGGTWEERRKNDPEFFKSVLATCPMGRMGNPDEVANVVLFLASPLASWVTAQIVRVAGGQGL
jgi:3-oxoacyl-[acyl-carrier protein] reductase